MERTLELHGENIFDDMPGKSLNESNCTWEWENNLAWKLPGQMAGKRKNTGKEMQQKWKCD